MDSTFIAPCKHSLFCVNIVLKSDRTWLKISCIKAKENYLFPCWAVLEVIVDRELRRFEAQYFNDVIFKIPIQTHEFLKSISFHMSFNVKKKFLPLTFLNQI